MPYIWLYEDPEIAATKIDNSVTTDAAGIAQFTVSSAQVSAEKPQLSVVKDVENKLYYNGETVTYIITATNPSTATDPVRNIKIIDTLQDNVFDVNSIIATAYFDNDTTKPLPSGSVTKSGLTVTVDLTGKDPLLVGHSIVVKITAKIALP